jgi:hypothetical protein
MGYKLADDPTLERDPVSKALVSNDFKALQATRNKIKERLDVNRLQTDLNNVKGELAEIKSMLAALVKGK